MGKTYIFCHTFVIPAANFVGEGEEAHRHEAHGQCDGAEYHLPGPGRAQLSVGTKHSRDHLAYLRKETNLINYLLLIEFEYFSSSTHYGITFMDHRFNCKYSSTAR